MKKADLIIKNGTIVTMNPEMEVIQQGCIIINDKKITELGKSETLLRKYRADQIIDAASGIVIPGLINAHTHIPMSFFRGLADDLPLMEWLQKHIWPAEAKFLSPEFVYHATLFGAAELIKNGITCFNDTYFYSKEVAKGASEAGLRGLIGEGILDFPFVGRKNAAEHIEYAKEFIEQFRDNELIVPTVSPHAIYSCCRETLMKTFDLASSNDLLLHIHVSETEQEVKDSLNNFGERPVNYLAELGFLDHKTIFAHGVWIDQQEMDVMLEKKVSNIICTESNLKLASGFAPVKEYLKKGVNLCLGTDGVSSNNDLDMFSEMDFTAKVHKALNSDPTIAPAREVFKMATINGARALHLEDKIGSLEVDKLADIVILDSAELNSVPLYNVYSYLVYTAGRSAVKDVVINGMPVMRERELLTLDEENLKQEAKIYAQKIQS